MYTINQLAKDLNVPVSTIRYYEKKGVIFPKREANNYRAFNEHDKNQLRLILVMKYSGFTLKQIKELLSLSDLPDDACKTNTDKMISKKREELLDKINIYKQVISLLDDLAPFAINNVSPDAEKLLFEQVNRIFENI
ncbi:MerR family transcriptional regulator [Enterococcus faecalis]|uniref:MerR family transcriptional regulator n=1 Tax=Enterococcus TaxID=1350 RepID=UPI003A952B6D